MKKKLKKNGKKNEKKLITIQDSKSPLAEVYRTLRTNIYFADVGKEIKTLMVTSTNPGEGKTTTISNLAVVIAQSGKKTLIVDTDLRKPNIHNIFGGDTKKGLTTLLAKLTENSRENSKKNSEESKSNLMNIIKKHINATEVEGLDCITSGPLPHNPSELIGSEIMKTFINEVREHYDMVLFDTSPIGFISDAVVLSSVLDGTLLVVSSGETKVDMAIKAKENLERANARIIGTVLKKTKVNVKKYYKYYG